jgi:WD40 repeat protein
MEAIKSGNSFTAPFVPPIVIPTVPTPANSLRTSRQLRKRAFNNPFDASDQTFSAHTDALLSLNLISSRYAISSSADCSVRVWDMDSQNCMHTLHGHTGWVHSIISDMGLHQNIDLDFVDDYLNQLPSSPKDEPSSSSRSDTDVVDHFEDICPFVISGSGDSTVRIWDLRKNKEAVQVLEGHNAGVLIVRCDQSSIVSGSVDRTIKLWDRETGKCTQTLKNESYVKTLQFLSYALISGGGDGVMKLWDLRSGKYFRTIDAHDGGISTLQFDTEKIISGGKDGKIRIFELASGKVLDALTIGTPITSLQFIKEKLVFAASRMAPVMYNMKSKTTVREFVGHTDNVSDLQFNRKRLVTASWDGTLKVCLNFLILQVNSCGHSKLLLHF